MNFFFCLTVAAGGAAGSLLRHLISELTLPFTRHFPWSTLAVNVLGCFIIGFFNTLSMTIFPAIPDMVRLFIMIGICGGFTTFSSFSLQTLDLFLEKSPFHAFANILLTCALCFFAVWGGSTLCSTFFSWFSP